jgi:hypothetical protein
MAGEPEIEPLNLEQKCHSNRELFNTYGKYDKPDVKFE